jgi:hypothetical protein
MFYAGLFIVAQSGANLARGKAVEVSPRPNYLKDAASQSASSLTDGKFAAGRLWLDQGTLGWSKVSPVTITIDLGRSTQVGSVVFSTAAGRAGVEVPRSILVLTSDDKRQWRYAGDLVRASGEDVAGPAEYTLLRITAKDLGAKGRYVRLLVTPQGTMAFCDEIEVYGGGGSSAQAEVGQDLDAFRKRLLMAGGLARRREFAAFALDNELARATIAAPTRSALSARLPNHRRSFRKPSAATSASYRFPDAEDLALGASFATLRRARGFAPVVAWRKHRFDPLEAHEAPPTVKPAASVAIEALRGETRSDSLLLSSSLSKATDVTLTLPGVGATGLTVAAVPWTDTVGGKLVASALPLVPVGAGYRFRLYPGVTTRVWFRLNTANRPAGQTQGQVRLSWAGGKLSVPMRVRVSPMKIGKPRLSVGLFDYSDGDGAYDLKGALLSPAIAAMKAHAVDSPWATSKVLPRADSAGSDMARLTTWVKRWPGARRYMVFANVKSSFGGTNAGTPAFEAKVGAWARALAAHMRALKVKPGMLTLLLIDEPNSDEQARTITAWARAIRKATPEISLMEDPEWADEEKPGPREALASVDIVTQFVDRLLTDPRRARLEQGQTLWLYQALRGGKALDPSQYYRLQAWFALRHGARGIAYWSLADDGGAPSSFQELAGGAPSASPAFLDRTRVVDSVHWQAMLEGVEDYELFMTLRGAAKTSAQRQAAESLIAEATDAVLRDYRVGSFAWSGDRRRGAADTYRVRAMRMLEGWR